MRYSSIRPERFKDEPTVTDIKAISYSEDGTLRVKLSFDDDWQILPVRPKLIPVPVDNYPKLHNSRLKLTASKWKHLQELKQFIPKDCQVFYDNLAKIEKDLFNKNSFPGVFCLFF